MVHFLGSSERRSTSKHLAVAMAGLFLWHTVGDLYQSFENARVGVSVDPFDQMAPCQYKELDLLGWEDLSILKEHITFLIPLVHPPANPILKVIHIESYTLQCILQINRPKLSYGKAEGPSG